MVCSRPVLQHGYKLSLVHRCLANIAALGPCSPNPTLSFMVERTVYFHHTIYLPSPNSSCCRSLDWACHLQGGGNVMPPKDEKDGSGTYCHAHESATKTKLGGALCLPRLTHGHLVHSVNGPSTILTHRLSFSSLGHHGVFCVRFITSSFRDNIQTLLYTGFFIVSASFPQATHTVHTFLSIRTHC